MPTFPVAGKPSPLLVYWQGQRGRHDHSEEETGESFHVWSLMPDLDVVGYYQRGDEPDSPTKPGIEKTRYRFGLFTEAGCHLVTLLGVYVSDLDAPNTA